MSACLSGSERQSESEAHSENVCHARHTETNVKNACEKCMYHPSFSSSHFSLVCIHTYIHV